MYISELFAKNNADIIFGVIDVNSDRYSRLVKKATPPTQKIKNCIMAFITGGILCAIGQGIRIIGEYFGMSEEDITLIIPVSLILLSSVLTSLGVFDKIAVVAGAGTLVPITGFANSIVSAAMEFRSEGKILGTGANMFRIAGPVLAYGSFAAVIYGVIYYVFMM